MVCEHLAQLECALLDAGFAETCRGQVWSDNCREWVYFDVVLDIEALQARFAFGPEVRIHENTDPRSGLERGLVCWTCKDAVMGLLSGPRSFP
jgi:hypothetical protein